MLYALGGYDIDPSDTRCGGFPLLPISTIKGSCAGLVLSGEDQDERGRSIKYPRHILAIKNTNDFYLTDMNSWGSYTSGKLWRLRENSQGKYDLELVFNNLNLPFAIKYGPDGYIYLGEQDKIIRFRQDREQESRETYIAGLPAVSSDFKHMHPLSQFVFLEDGSLLLNNGAPTDRCEEDAGRRCRSVEDENFASLWHLKKDARGNWRSEVYARGLRNSAAMIRHESGTILQAENGHELKSGVDKKIGPYEEINEILPGKHYGWPYCYNFFATTPEWTNYRGFPCSSRNDRYQTPVALMPPHSAPLDMIYYSGKAFPELKDHLLISWHGWRASGQRVAAYPTDERGMIVTEAVSPWRYGMNDGRESIEAIVRGGELAIAPYTEIMTGWGELEGVRPKGRPIGLAEGQDGSIWVVDDKNKTIIKMVPYDQEIEEVRGAKKDREIDFMIAFANDQLEDSSQALKQSISNNCMGCHNDFMVSNARYQNSDHILEYLFENSWLNPRDLSQNDFYKRISGAAGVLAMPPGSDGLSEDELIEIRNFIQGLPRLETKRLKVTAANIRNEEVFSIVRKSELRGLPVCGVLRNIQGYGIKVIEIIPGPTHNWAKVILEDSMFESTEKCDDSTGIYYLATSLFE